MTAAGGKGPAPKPAAKRARRNADPTPLRIVKVDPVDQPPLRELVGPYNPATEEPWTESTLHLWEELGEFVRVQLLQGAQWDLLSRAMILDDAVVRGRLKWASEARLQLAKFGIAPDDLARLRIQFAAADEADDKRRNSRTGADSRGAYSGLKATGTNGPTTPSGN